jgi:inhibitor of KinA
VVEFEEKIDPEINRRAVAVAETIQTAGLPGIRDVVPTFRSLTVHFDPLRVDYARLLASLEREADRAATVGAREAEPVQIPVCYGGELGPDLPAVAAFSGLAEQDVVRVHAARVYRVFMLGFVAGFAYLGIVDGRIAMPRHPAPRVRVPLGSVGVAGVQTGIYPAATPGGWQLIGRTPLKPFDPSRSDPFLLKAGDAVQFCPISREEFDRWPSG